MHPRARPLRFAMVGALTAATYFALTLLFATVLALPIQLAMVIAYPLSLLVHFSGQRWFVFRSSQGFALAAHRQAGRYVLIGGIQLVLSLIITTFAPRLLGIDERIVYVVATVSLAGAAYLLMSLHVFHGRDRALTAQRSG
jgi:putative flippase GtrA